MARYCSGSDNRGGGRIAATTLKAARRLGASVRKVSSWIRGAHFGQPIIYVPFLLSNFHFLLFLQSYTVIKASSSQDRTPRKGSVLILSVHSLFHRSETPRTHNYLARCGP